MELNLRTFNRICKRLHFTSGLLELPSDQGKYKDDRYVYQFLFLNTVFSSKSFLQMDQWGRLGKVQRFFGVKHFSHRRYRNSTVSDTTIEDRLAFFDSSLLRRINYRLLTQAQKVGLVEEDAIVDGSGLGKTLFSCLCFITSWDDVFFTDAEAISQRGKELLSSERLIRNCYQYRGGKAIRYLLVDALYFNERFYQLRQEGYVQELLIKYTPTSTKISGRFRRVLKRFEEMVTLYENEFQNSRETRYLRRMGFCCEKGYDKSRGISYTIYLAKNNSLDNRYQIARVEEYRQGKFLQQYYVITTDKNLTGKKMRSLARKRWYIENDGFKSFNAHVHSKRCWTHNDKVYLNLLLIQLLAFSLLVLFRREYGYNFARQYATKRISLKFVAMILLTGSFKGINWQDS